MDLFPLAHVLLKETESFESWEISDNFVCTFYRVSRTKVDFGEGGVIIRKMKVAGVVMKEEDKPAAAAPKLSNKDFEALFRR